MLLWKAAPIVIAGLLSTVHNSFVCISGSLTVNVGASDILATQQAGGQRVSPAPLRAQEQNQQQATEDM